MAKPIIITVDDEIEVLSAIERDLRTHYGSQYRIIKANSGSEALETVRQLKKRNSAVALFLADQRMPIMSGTEFLNEARKLYPEARKVLLTAYADTEAAIASINTIGLNYYLMKPWDPPENNLYPVLDDLLGEWAATVPQPYDGIRVAGTQWSARSYAIKDFLARNRIPYQWWDIEKNAEARALIESMDAASRQLPVVFFPDGTALTQPDLRALAEKVGLQTHASQPMYDLIIIGGGPAGLGAAVYGASEGLKTIMLEREATGGQAGTSSRIENYLGFPAGVSGGELARRATVQAQRFGAEILTTQEVVGVRVEDPYRIAVLADGTEVAGRTILISTGVSVRRLDVPGAEGLAGVGLYYGAAASEAVAYQGARVIVVGGANSAGQGAVFLSRYASRVTMLVRGSTLEAGMSQYLVDQIRATENIDVHLNSSVREIYGSDHVEALLVEDVATHATEKVDAAALFVFIGAQPYTDMVAGVVERDEFGFILTGTDLIVDGKPVRGWTLERDPFPQETSVPGIFAAGDVRHNVVRRVASAVGQGAIAVSVIHEYLRTV